MMTIFEALADPTRRHILDLLRDHPRSVNELVEVLQESHKVSQPGVSKHLKVLREAGLVDVRQDAQKRWYELRTEPLVEIDQWLASYRHLWEDRLNRLDDLLKNLQQNPPE